MVFLGMHLGHDASVSVVDESGKVLASVLQERITRVRHDYGLLIETVDMALSSAGVELADVGKVGVSATQGMPAIVWDPQHLKINDRRFAGGRSKLFTVQPSDDLNPFAKSFLSNNLGEGRKIPVDRFSTLDFYEFRDPILLHGKRFERKSLWKIADDIVRQLARKRQKVGLLSRFLGMPKRLALSHMALSSPISVSIRGVRFEGNFYSHHVAHVSSNILFDSTPRLVFSHDGGTGMESGGVWLWSGGGDLQLLSPHFLELGQMYDFVADRLGLGQIGGAGKMMGLAPYGDTVIPLPENMLGNLNDMASFFGVAPESATVFEEVWGYALNTLRELGFPTEFVGDSEKVLDQAPSAIANFLQRLVEETFHRFIRVVHQDLDAEAVGITGGFALNCPTNSRVAASLVPTKVVIEPHCEDGGCSIGAAALEHLNEVRFPGLVEESPRGRVSSNYAFLGAQNEAFKSPTDKSFLDEFDVVALKHPEIAIAGLISQDMVVGLFEGKSEVGPRALGHRSIIANPGPKENWIRVNRIKKREHWRPFAPAVLEDSLQDYFYATPSESPFMLFNFLVREEARDILQAVTHVDGTSRVQTVSRSGDLLGRILVELEQMGLPPVVLNTSLNGPGEPIVQRPEEAIRIFLESELEAIFISPYLVTKPGILPPVEPSSV